MTGSVNPTQSANARAADSGSSKRCEVVGSGNTGTSGSTPWNTVVALDLALLLAVVVLTHTDRGTSRVVRALDWRPLLLVGVVSYSVFLWHEPLIRWLDDNGLTFGGVDGFLLTLALTVALTLALSAATYRWVEAPSLRLKRRPAAAAQEEAAAAVGELSAAP